MSVAGVREAVTQAHHEEWARVVASLTRRFGDLDIAEEAAAESFAIAVTRWAVDGFDGTLWRGLTLAETLPAVGALLGFAAVFGLLASWRFRWNAD